MYKVVLVDDEPWILQGIASTFAWAQYDMAVAGSFTSARQALAAIKESKPDVVFTDIRMPGMTGLELLEALRRLGLDTEIVIISGYSEFQYAQEAIRGGAFDYCLKPVDESVSDMLLPRLKKRLDEKRRTLARKLVEFLDDEADMRGTDASALGLSSQFPYYQVAVFSDDAEDFLKRSLAGSTDTAFITLSTRRRHYLIANCTGDLSLSLQPYPGPDAIGISSVSDKFDHVPALVNQAMAAATSSFVTGRGGLYRYAPPQPQKLQSLVLRAAHLFDSRQAAELQALFRSLPDIWENSALTVEDLCWFWNRLSARMELCAPLKSKAAPLAALEWQQIEMQFEDMEDFCQTLLDGILRFHNNADQAGTPDAGFDKLLYYLRENYEKQLKLKELAPMFFLNKNYAGALFQKYAGMTFSEYVNKLRMEKARELLLTSSLPIVEVAEQTGYTDYFYFSKLFKKIFGVSPTVFRKTPLGGAAEDAIPPHGRGDV